MIADALHRLAHFLQASSLPCRCEQRGYMNSWRQRRDAELREAELRQRGEPTDPDAMDAAFRRVLAEGERFEDAA